MDDAEKLIIKTLSEKAVLKQRIFDNTKQTFNLIKKGLEKTAKDLNKQMKEIDERVRFEYFSNTEMEAELKFADDLLVFQMHTNIFQFDREHHIWSMPYLTGDPMNSYCGIINIYNFLSDSFRYNRAEDLGYLIGRIYVNKDNHFFIEGKRQLGYLYNDLPNAVVSKESLKNIITSSILYSLDFDLLVPPYDEVKIITVSQIQENITMALTQTGKRLGFKFYADET